MHDTIEISVACDTMEFEFILLSLCCCGPLHLTFLGDVAYACTNIQQVEEEDDEEEEDYQ